MSAPTKLSRRRFIASTAATAFGFQIVPRHVIGGPGFTPPSEMLNLGCIGVGGQGGGDIADMFGSGLVNVAALCDVDLDHAAGTIKKHDKPKLYRDYRKLIEGRRIYREGKDGERQYLSSEELDSARLNAKADVDATCNSAT